MSDNKFKPRIGHSTMRPTTRDTELFVGRTVNRFAPTPKHLKSCKCHVCRKGPRDNQHDGDIQRLRDDRAERRS